MQHQFWFYLPQWYEVFKRPLLLTLTFSVKQPLWGVRIDNAGILEGMFWSNYWHQGEVLILTILLLQFFFSTYSKEPKFTEFMLVQRRSVSCVAILGKVAQFKRITTQFELETAQSGNVISSHLAPPLSASSEWRESLKSHIFAFCCLFIFITGVLLFTFLA